MTTQTELNPVINDAIALLIEQVEQVEHHGDRPSGLDDWSVAELIGHVTGSLTKILHQLRGEGISAAPSSPQDFMTADAVGELRTLARQIDSALLTTDLPVERPSPTGPAPLHQALRFPVSDVIIHAWDVAHACGRSLELPDNLRLYAENLVGSLPAQQLRSPGGFAPATYQPTGASPTQRLMAFLGRTVTP